MKKYTIKPFHSQGSESQYPSGFDVVEIGEKSDVVVSPCDSEDEAKQELKRLEALEVN